MACCFVSIFFSAFEPFGMDGQHWNPCLFRDFSADSFNIVTYKPDDAGRIDKGSFWLILLNQLNERVVQLFFTAVNHVHLLQVGRKTQPVQFRT